jgi:N-acetylglucosaminyl-diphospho-decaprenol L-rhamnosyltransferase
VDNAVDRVRWAAVIVNYESGPLLLECVRSVLADTSAGPAEVMVVDNGSSDGSLDALRERFPEARVMQSPGNVGYARAANLGIAATRAPFIAVLNPDVTVAPGTARALVARLEGDARLGAVGPCVANVDGTVYPSARRQPSIPLAVGHGVFGLVWPTNPFTTRYRQLDADPERSREVDWVSGAAMWLRRAALDAVGAWDERYFMYMEDMDLCWRLRGAGWGIVYEPAGRVVHVQGAVTSRHPYRMTLAHHRSAWQFCRRRFTGLRAVLLPFAGIFLAFRAVMAMGEHAWRASGAPAPR